MPFEELTITKNERIKKFVLHHQAKNEFSEVEGDENYPIIFLPTH
jgi:hypothetical protein